MSWKKETNKGKVIKLLQNNDRAKPPGALSPLHPGPLLDSPQ